MTLNLSADLWQSLLCFPLLDAAWEKLRANGGCAGGDGVTIAQFQAAAGRRLVELANIVFPGAYGG